MWTDASGREWTNAHQNGYGTVSRGPCCSQTGAGHANRDRPRQILCGVRTVLLAQLRPRKRRSHETWRLSGSGQLSGSGAASFSCFFRARTGVSQLASARPAAMAT